MIKRLNLSTKKIKALWIVPVLSIFTLGFVSSVAPAISSAQALPKASCSITGVPVTVTNGEAVTPTIVVTNNSSKTFTSTFNVNEELVRNGKGKGGAAQDTVTVTPGQTIQFQGGTLYAQTGYKIKIVAKSVGKPHFVCKDIALVN